MGISRETQIAQGRNSWLSSTGYFRNRASTEIHPKFPGTENEVEDQRGHLSVSANRVSNLLLRTMDLLGNILTTEN
jgi:hypothetical protein